MISNVFCKILNTMSEFGFSIVAIRTAVFLCSDAYYAHAFIPIVFGSLKQNCFYQKQLFWFVSLGPFEMARIIKCFFTTTPSRILPSWSLKPWTFKVQIPIAESMSDTTIKLNS